MLIVSCETFSTVHSCKQEDVSVCESSRQLSCFQSPRVSEQVMAGVFPVPYG